MPSLSSALIAGAGVPSGRKCCVGVQLMAALIYILWIGASNLVRALVAKALLKYLGGTLPL